MKRFFTLTAAAATAAGILAIGTTAATAGERTSCDVPMDQWQTTDALKADLAAKGWEVRRVKVENGCYEVYAIDSNGNRGEGVFNPKTFEQVGSESEG
jgi:hypothetical protein